MTANPDFYDTLPKKRMGAGCLFFNEKQEVLLVKPTYKPGWEIPGGVVEENESPKQCCQREVFEELGLNRVPGALLVIDYSSRVGPKTESLMFVFDGGVLHDTEINEIKLPAAELSEFAFFSCDDLPKAMTSSLKTRVLAAWQQYDHGQVAYLENQKIS
ncbi:NUDIX domain-containing protein [Candidatus Leptofilum sp.]|uniref:NUDIX domain-containing protein n=1 Tax=Candidatus Leptofilum sp. TaxID=3241576 RepID=UPI003B5C98A8